MTSAPDRRDDRWDRFVKQEVSRLGNYPKDNEDILRRSAAFRSRIRAIGDYVNAYPVSTWPRYLVGLGSSLITAGIALSLTRGSPEPLSMVLSILLWGFGIPSLIVGLYIMKRNQNTREGHFVEGRRLFFVWAEKVGEPWRADLQPEPDAREPQGPDP
jgi:transglutaminase-like putative cysteine protease